MNSVFPSLIRCYCVRHSVVSLRIGFSGMIKSGKALLSNHLQLTLVRSFNFLSCLVVDAK